MNKEKKIIIHNSSQGELERELDSSNILYLWVSALFKDIKCPICGVIQGKPYKGFQRFFCKHITKRIDDFMKPINKKLVQDILKNVVVDREEELKKLKDIYSDPEALRKAKEEWGSVSPPAKKMFHKDLPKKDKSKRR